MASMRSWLSDVMTSKGSMAGFAAGHDVDVDVHAHAAACRGLRGGTREPRAAEVLDPHHQTPVEQLEAGLDEPLLLEGVAHLHAGALRRVGVRVSPLAPEGGRGQHAHPADPVAPGGRAQEHGQVALARGRPSTRRSVGMTPRHSTFTRGLRAYPGAKVSSPPTVGTPTELP